ncbi:NAD(P)H-binding protein [Bacillus sp. FJAT-27251]|uniref:NAD(P)H-binding protein n=1 Tax=Bacillus sp. FJAT-27251 TaxID=1684142 RepID=UPI0006A7DED6|nr:NAD(P)H-binding protein [Bacillus sp. FJAT-27251]
MRVLVIGTEDMTGEHVIKLLADKEHEPVAVVGSQNKVSLMTKIGASKVVVMETQDFLEAFSGCEAVIYLGAASPRTGEGKPILIDHQTMIASVEAASEHGVQRFVLLSPLRADENESGGPGTIGGKNQAEELLRQEEINYTIVRPSEPVEKPGSGKVNAAPSLKGEHGEIPKEDLASVLVEALDSRESFNKTFDVTSGETPIREALQQL